MVKFVDGQIDVLVSTAIVESGLDIPASNTIIINRADRFGLAQLYQLRGRVGRERQQAYAYLLIPADGRLDETAQRRLRVIEEMTELGAGFRLAMRDLEIRGSGNLLGAAQHGHIAAVGFDLYSKLLGEAVRELKGEPVGRARRSRDLGRRGGPPARGVRARGQPAPGALQAARRDRARRRGGAHARRARRSLRSAAARRRGPARRRRPARRGEGARRRAHRGARRPGRVHVRAVDVRDAGPHPQRDRQEPRCHDAQEGIHAGSARSGRTVARRSRRDPRGARRRSRDGRPPTCLRGDRCRAARRRARGLLDSVLDAADRQGQADAAGSRRSAGRRAAPAARAGGRAARAAARLAGRDGPRDLRREQRRHHALRARRGRGPLPLREQAGPA